MLAFVPLVRIEQKRLPKTDCQQPYIPHILLSAVYVLPQILLCIEYGASRPVRIILRDFVGILIYMYGHLGQQF